MKSDRERLQREEAGFTIIEVLMTIVVLGFIASAVAGAIVLFFRTADGTSSRLSLSHDSQLLAIYLVPDLNSLGQGQPVVTSAGPAACGQAFSDLQINFTGVNPLDIYQADYAPNGTSIIRTLTHQPPGGSSTATKTIVSHNLKPGNACFSSVSGPGPWTMTVTVEAKSDPSTDYTFSVTGGRATAPPALCSATCAQPGLVSKDTDGNGKIDHIVAAFDELLNTADTAGISEWALSGQPAGVGLTSATVSGSSVTLALSEGTSVDTYARGLMVTFQPDPGGQGVRNAANQPATAFGATGVTDGMAPVLTSIISQDVDSNGRMDHVQLTFSEPLQPLAAYTAGTAPWTMSGQPSGVTVKGPDSVVNSAVDSTVTLQLNEGTGYDTLAAGFQLAMGGLQGGIRDLADNLSSFGPTNVGDGMTPVATSLVSKDSNQDGKVDRVVITFSESLIGYAPAAPPWTLIGQPAGVSLDSAAAAGNIVTLFLNPGTGIDTTAAGFQVSLASDPNGVRDGSGHVSSFSGQSVSDGMGPVIVGLTSTDSTASNHDVGRMEAGDTLTLTFSEDLAPSSLPPGPVLQLVPGASGADDQLLIPGVATIDLGGSDLYVDPSTAKFASTLSGTGPAVTITVGANMTGSGSVLQANHQTVMKVIPLAGPANSLPKDGAGNAADGLLTTPTPMYLF